MKPNRIFLILIISFSLRPHSLLAGVENSSPEASVVSLCHEIVQKFGLEPISAASRDRFGFSKFASKIESEPDIESEPEIEGETSHQRYLRYIALHRFGTLATLEVAAIRSSLRNTPRNSLFKFVQEDGALTAGSRFYFSKGSRVLSLALPFSEDENGASMDANISWFIAQPTFELLQPGDHLEIYPTSSQLHSRLRSAIAEALSVKASELMNDAEALQAFIEKIDAKLAYSGSAMDARYILRSIFNDSNFLKFLFQGHIFSELQPANKVEFDLKEIRNSVASLNFNDWVKLFYIDLVIRELLDSADSRLIVGSHLSQEPHFQNLSRQHDHAFRKVDLRVGTERETQLHIQRPTPVARPFVYDPILTFH